MQDLPTWLTEILRQFPMVVVIGLAVRWAYNRLERREKRQEDLLENRENRLEVLQEKLRQEVRQAADEEIKRCLKVLQDALASKDKEIDRLNDILTNQIKKMAKDLDQVTKKLSD